MKILKLLNKKNLSILLIFCFLFLQNANSIEPVDIWNLEKKINQNKVSNIENNDNESESSSSIFGIQSEKKDEPIITEENTFDSKNLNIVGIYDPADNDLSINMWSNSNGTIILKIIEKIKNTNLSEDSEEILNLALLTNSYFPTKNIMPQEFLKIKSDWLLKKKNYQLIKSYLEKNRNLNNKSELIEFYVNYYLSKSDLAEACTIFAKANPSGYSDYVSKFNIYCLVHLNKNEEAQLNFDLLKENGFQDNSFEKKFNYLMGYDTNIDSKISEESLLDFHLSHRTNPDFKFEPKINTSKLIWKYMYSSNLLESIDFIDIEDKNKIFSIEKATHDKNYNENELFALYERFMFNINQLLTVKDAYKLLPNSEARALLFQGILINPNPSEKIQLIKLLKDLFEKDNIANAFDIKLVEFLKKIDAIDVPSDYTNFYQSHLKINSNKNEKIKFNNKIIHQSKLLNYFNEDLNNKSFEKDLENFLKKIKKNKKYFFSLKDIILLESLKADGIIIPKKYENIYEQKEAIIPYDIQILINNEEIGLALLRLVEIIGQDRFVDMDPETLYFIISTLNQLNIDKLRNKIILKVLPLKV